VGVDSATDELVDEDEAADAEAHFAVFLAGSDSCASSLGLMPPAAFGSKLSKRSTTAFASSSMFFSWNMSASKLRLSTLALMPFVLLRLHCAITSHQRASKCSFRVIALMYASVIRPSFMHYSHSGLSVFGVLIGRRQARHETACELDTNPNRLPFRAVFTDARSRVWSPFNNSRSCALVVT